MALIKCPECGREISDKAVSCPGCGYPIQDMVQDNRSDLDKLVDEICERNPDMYVAIKELRKATELDLKSADDIIRKKYKGTTLDEEMKSIKEEAKQERRKNGEDIRTSLQTLANLSAASKVAKCPKCGSTSISYDTKKLSFCRALVGDALAGPTGAIIGGLSSKKGYAVCLKCGKRWKI